MQALELILQDAASMGITVCVAAGDHGSSDYWLPEQSPDDPNAQQCLMSPTPACANPPDGQARADFPASSPYALGCGGTTLNSSAGTITSEVVWNNNNGWATGGGVSGFPVPAYQGTVRATCNTTGTAVTGRGVPDVAGDADADTGYNIIVDDATIPPSGGPGPQVGGGTSAVAPLWAGLIALLNQSIGANVGFINTLIYSSGGTGFNDITSGNNDTVGNGCYQATTGWDACTGWGSPNGTTLLGILHPTGGH